MSEIIENLSKVNISEDQWREALVNHKIVTDEFDGITYYRFVKKVGLLDKGSVVTESDIIFHFPQIARVLQLENGIRAAFSKPFYIEEKVDGYNVRVAKIGDTVLAFTRGSYVCPFSTDRLRDFFDIEEFFNENPHLIVCGEIAGPGNPYNKEYPPYVTEDVQFFAFDIRKKNTDKNVTAEDKYGLLDRYKIPTVTRFGKHVVSDVARIKEILKELNSKGCEGIVLKPTFPGEKTVKYVTAGSCYRDIRVTSSLMLETPAEFFIQRLFRSVFYHLDNDLPLDKTVFQEVGESLLLPLSGSAKKAVSGEMVAEDFSVRFIHEQNIQKLFDHFHKCNVTAALINRRKIGDYWHVKFQRRCYPTYEMIRKYWEGLSHFD
ncbi:MAG: RNA ligase [Planctomycetes bacterium]|nr:RNA ligase [Planctomycetota bacterium]